MLLVAGPDYIALKYFFEMVDKDTGDFPHIHLATKDLGK